MWFSNDSNKLDEIRATKVKRMQKYHNCLTSPAHKLHQKTVLTIVRITFLHVHPKLVKTWPTCLQNVVRITRIQRFKHTSLTNSVWSQYMKSFMCLCLSLAISLKNSFNKLLFSTYKTLSNLSNRETEQLFEHIRSRQTGKNVYV